MSDSESDDEKQTDEVQTKFNLMKSIKVAGIIAMIFVFLMTDVFIETVLEKMNSNFVSDRKPTTSGMLAQALILTMSVVLVDYIVSLELI